MDKKDNITKIKLSEPDKFDPTKLFDQERGYRKQLAIYTKDELNKLTNSTTDLTFWENLYIFIQAIKKAPKILKLILQLIRIYLRVKEMKKKSNDEKTTIAGIVKMVIAFIVSIVNLIWGADIPADIQSTAVSVAVGLWGLIEYFSGKWTNNND